MAYNNYFPAGYQPMYYPQQNQISQPQNPQQSINNSMIWVQGEASAKSYPVAPNTSVPLWDSEANVIYVKSADAAGIPSMRIIDYTVRDNASKTPEIAPQGDFATKDDVEYLKGEISSLRAKFERLGGNTDKRKEKSDGK